jgi:hypothetical protein
MFAHTKCRFCSAPLIPATGVVAAKSFCGQCRKERRQVAKKVLALKPISLRDLDGDFLLPRALRKNRKRKRAI